MLIGFLKIKVMENIDLVLNVDKVKQLKKVVELVSAENSELKELKSNYETAEATINSMSEMQEKLKHHLKGSVKFGVDLADSIGLASNNQKAGFDEASKSYATALQSIAELAGLNKEDSAAIATKSQEIDNQIAAMKSQLAISEGLFDEKSNSADVDRAIISSMYQQIDALSTMKEEAGKFEILP